MVSDAKKSELLVAKTLKFVAGSIVVFDRGYIDYEWWGSLTNQGVFLVSRLRRNSLYIVVERRRVDRRSSVTSDVTIRLTGAKASRNGPDAATVGRLPRPLTGKHYRFVINRFDLSPKTIGEISKSRWEVELFFRWIKQNLKLRTFVGTTRNAILTQVWVAMCVCLLLNYLKLLARIDLSIGDMLRLIQVNLFNRRGLLGLLGKPPPPPSPDLSAQLVLV